MTDYEIKIAVISALENYAKRYGLTNLEAARHIQEFLKSIPESFTNTILLFMGVEVSCSPSRILRILNDTLSEIADSTKKSSDTEKLLGNEMAFALRKIKKSLESNTHAFRKSTQENIVVRELLMLIGISFDEYAPDNIKKYAKEGGELYSIDMATFKPYKLSSAPKNYTTNLFRIEEHAYKALVIVKELTNDYAIWEKQEN